MLCWCYTCSLQEKNLHHVLFKRLPRVFLLFNCTTILEDEDDQPVKSSDVAENFTQDQDVTANVPALGPDINTDANVAEYPSARKGPSIRIQKIHPQDNIIGSPTEGVMARSRKLRANAWFISNVEPKNVKEALTDEYWINVMQEELGQFKRNEVWNLVPRPWDQCHWDKMDFKK